MVLAFVVVVAVVGVSRRFFETEATESATGETERREDVEGLSMRANEADDSLRFNDLSRVISSSLEPLSRPTFESLPRSVGGERCPFFVLRAGDSLNFDGPVDDFSTVDERGVAVRW